MIALVTGASSGIGRSLALQFAAGGYDLVLTARSEPALQELAAQVQALGRTAHVIVADLGAADGASRLHEVLVRDGINVDVLVNNAGFGLQGRFDTLPLDRQLAMIQLNVTSLTALTRVLLPGMLARNSGGVLNVASTAAFQPGPLMTVYYATKAYVLSFTEAVAEEVAESRLNVSCLCPGPTHTGFVKAAGMTGSRLFKAGAMTADDVAQQGFEGWSNRKRVVIPGFRNRLGAFSVRLVPRRIVPTIVKRLNVVE
jgi:uncharacterized protein